MEEGALGVKDGGGLGFGPSESDPHLALRERCASARCSLLVVRCSLFAARCSLLVVRCSLFAARTSLSVTPSETRDSLQGGEGGVSPSQPLVLPRGFLGRRPPPPLRRSLPLSCRHHRNLWQHQPSTAARTRLQAGARSCLHPASVQVEAVVRGSMALHGPEMGAAQGGYTPVQAFCRFAEVAAFTCASI